LHKVRLLLAGAALKRWKGDPLFEVHALEAKYPKGFDARSERDLNSLELALTRARAEGDTRTAVRIEKILAEADPFAGGPMSMGPPGADFLSSAPDARMLARLIDVLGLDKVLSMLGLPPDMRRDLKGMARRLGEQEVAETLISLLGKADELVDLEGIPPIPRPPPRKPPPPRERPARTPEKDANPGDEPPDQLDLFS
jgi:hypothetical protein